MSRNSLSLSLSLSQCLWLVTKPLLDTPHLTLMAALVSLADWERAALEMPSLSKPALGYFTGGACDEKSLVRNVSSFDAWWLSPRYLIDVSKASTRSTLLGRPVAQPFGIAPTAFQRLLHNDGEAAMSRAAADAGVPLTVSTFATHSLEDVASFGASVSRDSVRLMQLYAMTDRGVTRNVVQRAEAAGYAAIVLTVDRPVLGRREANLRSKFDVPWELHRDPNGLNTGGVILNSGGGVIGGTPPIAEAAATIAGATPLSAAMTGAGAVPVAAAAAAAVAPSALYSAVSAEFSWSDLAWLRSVTRLPIVLKGILSPEDATCAVAAGVAGVWISNHGGRQLDSAPGGIDALPAIVAAVRAAEEAAAVRAAQAGGPIPPPFHRRMEIYIDGGVRRGTDVVKCLALGADFVWIGRPPLWGLTVKGQEGVAAVLSALGEETLNAMQLVGVNSVNELTRRHVIHTTQLGLDAAPEGIDGGLALAAQRDTAGSPLHSGGLGAVSGVGDLARADRRSTILWAAATAVVAVTAFIIGRGSGGSGGRSR